ncbi:hypothetical protein BZG35_04550 [Brevundimonas sp. LM2]|uniref:hypothetical protein n=1 Tax=Brevundimonas sp. LM2 TaxID=1938605 RepID=UPI000983B2FA|nr:hypothetical protein [Brevundimonas sp. LM2]AQR61011.1 hypothetical protein BZG35_04550 [Brevundimonas sp. LM2]
MDEARLTALAEIWGGDLRRWPAADGEAAARWMAANPAPAERALFAARQLDAALDASAPPIVSTALRDRVVASASAAGLKARAGMGAALKRLFWIGGVGWAAAACAGVIFGTTLGSQRAAELQTDLVLEQAMVTGLDDTMVLG